MMRVTRNEGPRVWVSAWALVLLGAASISGCSKEVTDEEPPEEVFCSALCHRASTCGLLYSVRECSDYCIADPGDLGAMRGDAVRIISDCITATACAAFNPSDAFAVCLPEANLEVAPSSQAREFCVGQATFWFECHGLYTVEECLEDYKLWSDETLSRAGECHQEPNCDVAEECLYAAFE